MNIDANTLFSVLSNGVRLRCLVLLQLQGELCVCELIQALSLSQPMISRHLALLRDSGLVKDRRAGQWIYYRIHPDLPNWAKNIVKITAQANCMQIPFSKDIQNFLHMPNRPDSAYKISLRRLSCHDD